MTIPDNDVKMFVICMSNTGKKKTEVTKEL